MCVCVCVKHKEYLDLMKERATHLSTTSLTYYTSLDQDSMGFISLPFLLTSCILFSCQIEKGQTENTPARSVVLEAWWSSPQHFSDLALGCPCSLSLLASFLVLSPRTSLLHKALSRLVPHRLLPHAVPVSRESQPSDLCSARLPSLTFARSYPHCYIMVNSATHGLR